MKILLLIFALIFCLAACSDPPYRVVQMEDDSYVIQVPSNWLEDGWVDLKIGYFDSEGSYRIAIYRYATRQKACMECNELIQAKIDEEAPHKVRRVMNCQ